MTTIAWRDGLLCADKQASSDDTAYKTTKLHRTKTHAIAFAGDLGVGLKFVDWFKKKKGDCPLNEDTEALVMCLETGECELWDDAAFPIPIEDKFAAIGSGQRLAVGAMSFGATAIEAVQCAIEWDNCSGFGYNYARSRPHINKWGKKFMTYRQFQ